MANSLRRKREDTRRGFLDEALCSRVGKTVAAFEHAFDAAVTQSTPEALDELHEAADQLMRAVSRVLLEISGADARPPQAPQLRSGSSSTPAKPARGRSG